MRVGKDYFYIEAREEDVVFFSKDVRVFGNDFVSERSVAYSDITSVKVICTGGLTPYVRIYVYFEGSPEPYKMGFAELPGEAVNKRLQEMNALKKYIEDKARRARNQNNTNNSNSSVADILKLKELLDSGLITIDEFNTMKARVMDTISSEEVDEEYDPPTEEDFIIDLGKGKANWVDFAKSDEFCFFSKADAKFKATRGIKIDDTYDKVFDLLGNLDFCTDDEFDCSDDLLYLWAQDKGLNEEIEILNKCTDTIEFTLEKNNREYGIRFYFDKNEKLCLVGYFCVADD